jgi:uncharacterized protein YhdP
MMKPRRKKIVIILSVLAVLLVAAGLIAVYLELADLSSRKEEIVQSFKAALNRDVSYDSADLSFSLGPVLTFRGVQIRERDGSSTFAAMDQLELRVALLPLFRKQVVIKRLIMEKPRLMLLRYPSGKFNISDLIEDHKDAPRSVEIRGLAVNGGHVEFLDQKISKTGIKTVLDGIRFRIGDLRRGEASHLDLETAVIQGDVKGDIALHGKIGIAAAAVPLYRSRLEGGLVFRGLSLDRFWPYYRSYVPFEKMAGRLDLDSHLKGNIDNFSISGTVSVQKAVLAYPGVFPDVLKPQDIKVTCQLKKSPSDIAVENIRVTVDGMNITGRFAMKDMDKDDPFLSASATTNPFALASYGTYIPYGIIPGSVAGFIKKHIAGGTYQLLDGSLAGRVSQIAHMGTNENYKTLHIRAGVKDGRLTFGETIPMFTKISGELELKDKDFHLRQMTGYFGESPLSLEGRITDYPVSVPTTYPFQMTMTPGPREIAWLLGKERAEQFFFSGKSVLRLTGKGTYDQYELEGDWDLADASYRYNDTFVKRQGQPNRIAFKSLMNDNEARLVAGNYDLAPLSIKVSGLYPFHGKRAAFVSFDSNLFRLQDIESAFPAIAKWRPSGNVRVSARLDGIDGAADDIRWQGAVTLADVSFLPGETIKAVSSLNGTVQLQNEHLETSLIRGQIGNTPFQARAILSGFAEPTLDLRLSAKTMDLRDIGLEGAAGPVLIKDFKGNINWSDRGIRIRSLAAAVNGSDLTVSGNVTDMPNPHYDIQVTSSHLDTDDLKIFADLAKSKRNGTSREVTVKATIHALEGKLQSVPYNNLSADLSWRQETLYVDSLRFNTLGGKVSGSGRVVLTDLSEPRYKVDFNIDNISAGQTMAMVGLDPELMTGEMNIKGDLAGSGTHLSDIKRTVTGAVNLRADKGTLRKFQVLSKVFSILNVSQLFKFQLPDMVSGGMPYSQITGRFTLKDGILASDDLYVKSDAMNITIIGKVDLVKGELEETIGVQPLQTVDKVVSHIPIVGWILTNETNSLVTMYFTAKGKWDNPDVQAVPVKDMAEGVLNIFRRLFQLPLKLITDTGDVILGR